MAPKPTKETAPKPNNGNGAWRNRIVGHEEVPPDQLLANPANWRTHPKAQMDALEEVMDTVGVVDSVMVNRSSGYVIDGHARIQLALRRDEPTVPVDYVELTDKEEALVLATFDPLAAMATTDSEKLGELLDPLVIDEGSLADMLAGLGSASPAKVEASDIECPSCGHRWSKQ